MLHIAFVTIRSTSNISPLRNFSIVILLIEIHTVTENLSSRIDLQTHASSAFDMRMQGRVR